VALVRTDSSEERIVTIIRVTRIGGLGTLAVKAKHAAKKYYVTLMMEAICFFDTLVLTRATQYNIPEYGILQGNGIFVKSVT
jgi:biotin carboxylase